jgi:serine/threonine protein kinase
VKVLDFGIAKMADEDAGAGSLTVAAGILGTPVYMAPERFRGEAIDGASDVYSVGVMLYQMLAGRVPFCAPDSDL